MLEFKKIVLEVDIYGEVYKLNKPSGLRVLKWLEDIEKLSKKKNVKPNADFELAAELLLECGLPNEAFSGMYDNDQIELVNALVTAKKE